MAYANFRPPPSFLAPPPRGPEHPPGRACGAPCWAKGTQYARICIFHSRVHRYSFARYGSLRSMRGRPLHPPSNNKIPALLPPFVCTAWCMQHNSHGRGVNKVAFSVSCEPPFLHTLRLAALDVGETPAPPLK